MDKISAMILFLIATLLTGGLVIEHSRLAIIPFIAAIIFGIAVICIENNKKC